jgi:hypothetical protein
MRGKSDAAGGPCFAIQASTAALYASLYAKSATHPVSWKGRPVLRS